MAFQNYISANVPVSDSAQTSLWLVNADFLFDRLEYFRNIQLTLQNQGSTLCFTHSFTESSN